jgi:hypothetical protein
VCKCGEIQPSRLSHNHEKSVLASVSFGLYTGSALDDDGDLFVKGMTGPGSQDWIHTVRQQHPDDARNGLASMGVAQKDPC